MTHKEKCDLLKKKPPEKRDLCDYYYEVFNQIGAIKQAYGDYMVTEPINCDEELKRVPTADYDLCCALMTMLFREDHFFGYGCFDRRCGNGDVQKIIDRMLTLLDDRKVGLS